MKKTRTKVKVLAAALLAGVLCAGTVAAQAGTVNGTVGGSYVGGDTSITVSSAYARTLSAYSGVSTSVRATYYYIDMDTHTFHSETLSDAAERGSMVSFSVDSLEYESYDIEAYHYASYNGESWGDTSYEKY